MLKEIKALGPNNNTIFEQINRNHQTRETEILFLNTVPAHNNSLFFSEDFFSFDIVVHFLPFALVLSFPLV